MKDNTTQEYSCLLDAEHVFETFAEMSIEIVQDQMNAARLGIDLFEQIADESHEVAFGAVICGRDRPPPALRLHRHKQIADASAPLL